MCCAVCARSFMMPLHCLEEYLQVPYPPPPSWLGNLCFTGTQGWTSSGEYSMTPLPYETRRHRVKLAHLAASMPESSAHHPHEFPSGLLGPRCITMYLRANQDVNRARGERACRVCGGTEVRTRCTWLWSAPHMSHFGVRLFSLSGRTWGVSWHGSMLMKLGNLLTQICRARKETLRV